MSDDELVELLGHSPKELIQGVITLPDFPEQAVLERVPASSSMGSLDSLPHEVLGICLEYADLQAVARLACTSNGARHFVHSLPAYRELVHFASGTLAALGQTNTACLHSLNDLQAALRSSSCVSCGEYGEYLFLLTAERCCEQCLGYNKSLWLITKSCAKEVFELSAPALKQLPAIHTITGRYRNVRIKTIRRRFRLVSVKQAMRTAFEQHDTGKPLRTKARPLSRSVDYRVAERLMKAPLKTLPKHPSLIPDSRAYRDQPEDPFAGLGAAPFPFLNVDGQAEQGLWCRGCEREVLKPRYSTHPASRGPRDPRVPPHPINPTDFWANQYRLARSRCTFLEHIRSCLGCSEILEETHGKDTTANSPIGNDWEGVTTS